MTTTNYTSQQISSTTITNIPLTELNQILQTKSSVETTVLLLNETEEKYLLKPKHWNAKRAYPYWKACQLCQTLFTTHNKAQALRNKTCSKYCKGKMISKATSGKRQEKIQCLVCQKMFYPTGRSKTNPRITCSRECNGYLRGQEWKQHAHKGRANWKPESEQALVIRMTGETNPSWKGGLTYRNRKGKYASQAIKYVRCPKEYLAMARTDGYVMEHRLLVAQQIGRPLTRSESVHHVNHDATDNRIENLMLFKTNGEHKRYEWGQDITPLWQPLSQ